MRAGAFLIIAGLVAAPAAADEQPVCAARPGKSTPTCTLPAGHFQLETGLADWSLRKADGERDTSLAIGETTVKYGLTDRSDIEVRCDSVAALQVAALPFVKIPTASHALGNGKWEGGLPVPIGYSIPRKPLSIGLTPELNWPADGDGHGHFVQVVSLGWQATDKLNLSGELWGQWDWTRR